MFRRIRVLTVLSVLLIGAIMQVGWAGAAGTNKLEIFSWWTAGG